MILVGIKLMFIGMAIVFIFLVLLVYTIKLSHRLLAGQTRKELEALRAVSGGKLKKRKEEIIREEDEILVAVISAAVAAHHANIKLKKYIKKES
jgi:sodium pump decarboxylase gamma subunit